jgi:hypothetical protein
MSFLMKPFDAILPGTALFLLFMQALFFGALLIIVRFARRVGFWTPVVIAAVCLHPFILVYQGIVWKDVLFANFSVLAFALLFAAYRVPQRARHAIYVLSLASAACGGLVRQNGAVALFVVVVAILYHEVRFFSLRAQAAKLVAGGLIAAAVMLVAGAGSNVVIRASAKQSPEDTMGMALIVVMRYDISGILARNPNADVSFLTRRGLDMPAVVEDSRRYYSPDRLDWFGPAQHFGPEMVKLTLSQLIAAWARLLAENPLTYLRHRLAVFRWMMWPPDIDKCLPFHVGIDGPADLLARLDMTQSLRPSDNALNAYTSRFVHGPLYRHGVFLVAAIVLGAFALVRYGADAAAPAVALLAAATVFALSWLLIGISCDTRYVYFLPLGFFVGAIMTVILEAEARLLRMSSDR